MAFFPAISDGNPLARDPWPHHHFRKSSGGLAYGSPGRGTAPGAFEGGTGGIPSPGRPRGLAARCALANTSAIILSVSEVQPDGAGRVGGGLTPGASATIL